VGDAFFGVESNFSIFVEYFWAKPPPDWLDEGVGAGGEIVLEVS
jgi:hypothetical protein